MAIAGTPNSGTNHASIARMSEECRASNRANHSRAGATFGFSSIIGTNHGTTNRTSEMPNQRRRFVRKRVMPQRLTPRSGTAGPRLPNKTAAHSSRCLHRLVIRLFRVEVHHPTNSRAAERQPRNTRNTRKQGQHSFRISFAWFAWFAVTDPGRHLPRITSRVSDGGPRAVDLEQERNPTVHCTRLVRCLSCPHLRLERRCQTTTRCLARQVLPSTAEKYSTHR
jgi:hypothetical protein